MTRTKNAKDKKKRKKETKVRDTLGYFLRHAREKEEKTQVLLVHKSKSSLTPEEEKRIRITLLWKQLDCIRRIPGSKIEGRRAICLSPPRSRVVQKRPIPAKKGKFARHWYRKRVSKLLIRLFGEDLSRGWGASYIDDFYNSELIVIDYPRSMSRNLNWMSHWERFVYNIKDRIVTADKYKDKLWRIVCQRRFIKNVLYTAVCREMENENEELALKRPFKTEQEIIAELTQLGCFVPK